jgi:hypothetical protein
MRLIIEARLVDGESERPRRATELLPSLSALTLVLRNWV